MTSLVLSRSFLGGGVGEVKELTVRRGRAPSGFPLLSVLNDKLGVDSDCCRGRKGFSFLSVPNDEIDVDSDCCGLVWAEEILRLGSWM